MYGQNSDYDRGTGGNAPFVPHVGINRWNVF